MPDAVVREVGIDERTGPILSARMWVKREEGAPSAQAVGTDTLPFEEVRDLLSPKPLHRRGDKLK